MLQPKCSINEMCLGVYNDYGAQFCQVEKCHQKIVKLSSDVTLETVLLSPDEWVACELALRWRRGNHSQRGGSVVASTVHALALGSGGVEIEHKWLDSAIDCFRQVYVCAAWHAFIHVTWFVYCRLWLIPVWGTVCHRLLLNCATGGCFGRWLVDLRVLFYYIILIPWYDAFKSDPTCSCNHHLQWTGRYTWRSFHAQGSSTGNGGPDPERIACVAHQSNCDRLRDAGGKVFGGQGCGSVHAGGHVNRGACVDVVAIYVESRKFCWIYNKQHTKCSMFSWWEPAPTQDAPCFPDENQHQPEQTIHFSFEGSACSMTQVKSSSEGQRGVLTRNGAARRGACGCVAFMFLRRVWWF